MTRRILVTGANGFLGSRLCRSLASVDGTSVIGTTHHNRDRLPHAQPSNISFVRCDLTDRVSISDLFRQRRYDAVIHTAALLSFKSGEYAVPNAVLTNVLAHSLLVSEAMRNGCRHFVYCSSISVYDGAKQYGGGFREEQCLNPTSLYGWSKLAGEEVLRLQVAPHPETRATSLRLAGIHGGGRGSGVIHAMISAARENHPIVINEPESKFRLLFIDDAIDAIALAVTPRLPVGYSRFNVAGSEISRLEEVAKSILKITGSRSPVLRKENLETRNQVMDISRAKNVLGFSPKPMEENLMEIIRNEK